VDRARAAHGVRGLTTLDQVQVYLPTGVSEYLRTHPSLPATCATFFSFFLIFLIFLYGKPPFLLNAGLVEQFGALLDKKYLTENASRILRFVLAFCRETAATVLL
jgi:hypothetical protein